MDPRKETVIKEGQGHSNIRSQKFSWMGEASQFVTTGFGQNGKREVTIWDYDSFQKLHSRDIDNGAHPLLPHFDSATNVLFLAGKGDGSIRCFELHDNVLHPLPDYRDG